MQRRQELPGEVFDSKTLAVLKALHVPRQPRLGDREDYVNAAPRKRWEMIRAMKERRQRNLRYIYGQEEP